MKVVAFDVGIVNMAYAVVEKAENDKYRIHTWTTINIGRCDIPSDTLVSRLVQYLHNNAADFREITDVIIERQMVMRMSVLAHVIQAFFLVRNMYSGQSVTVLLQHPTRKNQCGPWLSKQGLPASANNGANYRVYKKRAVHDAGQSLHLQDDALWVDVFHSRAKQDDLADALLHALWYMFVRTDM